MGTKFTKKIFAILIVIALVIQILPNIVTAALNHDTGTPANFGISILGPTGRGYRIGGGSTPETIIFRIGVKTSNNSSNLDYSNSVYCLAKTKKFPTDDDNNTGNYKSVGTASSSNITEYDSIKKIIDAMYIPGTTNREQWIKKYVVPLLKAQLYDDDDTVEQIYNDINDPNSERYYLSDDDIFVTQQLAIWHFTETNFDWPGASLVMTKTDSRNFPTNGIAHDYSGKYEAMRLLYNYLTNNPVADSSYITQSSVWKVDPDNNEMQPLLYVSKTPIKYDAALSKTIIAHKKAGESSYTNVTGRERGPVEKVEGAATIDKQTKEAYNVGVGDFLQYKITVYNQGDQKIQIKSIRDYLPAGLEMVSVSEGTKTSATGNKTINEHYGWAAGVSTFLSGKVLSPKTGDSWAEGTSCESVIIECKVTGDPGELKNYAEITEMSTEDGNQIINGVDSTNSPKEYDSNPINYNNGAVKNEDDTDYEIINVQGQFDLSLKKYVKTLNGQEVTPSRESYSKETKTNSTVAVKEGDVVIFTIKPHNDGTQDGYVTEIKDYIPKGLAFLPTYKFESNSSSSWQIIGDATTKKIGNLSINVNNSLTAGNFTFSDTETNRTLQNVDIVEGPVTIKTESLKDSLIQAGRDGGTVQVACLVTSTADLTESTIKNIAEISGHKDKTGNTNVTDSDSTPGNYPTSEDDDDYDVLSPENPEYDLALKKFVSSVNNDTTKGRTISYDASALAAGTSTNANYTLSKTPVQVQTGDTVTFTIRVYNEGTAKAKVTEITDTIPDGLKLKSGTTNNSKWTMYDQTGEVTTNPANAKTIKTTALANEEINGISGTTLSYKDIQVDFEVTGTTGTITNFAKITGDNGNDRDDPTDREDRDHVTPENPVPDLALKKFVSGVNGKEREVGRSQIAPTYDTTALAAGTSTNATYTLSKDPVQVKEGDTVTFTIRVYNEGSVDARSIEITDTIPDGLEFIKNSDNNVEYGWTMYDSTGTTTTDVTKAKTLKTTISSTINAFDGGSTLSCADVKVDFKVTSKENKSITNIAKITGGNNDDRDSTDIEDQDSVIPVVYDLALQKYVTKVNDDEISGREPKVSKTDDGELEYTTVTTPVTVFNGDKVEYTIRVYNEGNQDTYAKEVIDDIPDGVKFLPDNKTNKDYGWKMYKEAGKNDSNKTTINGKEYVETDDPDEADLVLTNYLEKDEDEENLIKGFKPHLPVPSYSFSTDSADTNAENAGKTFYNPDYRDIKLVFEVVETNVTTKDRTITNTATATKLTDKDGKEVEDEEPEDNTDKEFIALKYFDLSLKKFVSKVIVTEDGTTKETETGYTGNENPEPMVKVEINRKKLNSTEVKYVYTLKVTNEGEIPGFATEITDRIPEGMAFYAEDNKNYGWVIKEDGIVTTDYLIKEIIEPGESKEIQITLRWENSESNLGQKVNVAEITGDYNEYGAKDIDSTPGNNKDGEDDQDNAIAMLSIKTGSAPMYIGIVIAVISMIGIGGFLIKKYVL